MSRLDVKMLDDARPVGPFEIEVDPGIECLSDINDGLGAKGNRQLGAVVELGVKIPPLVCAFAAIGPHPIFPEFNMSLLTPKRRYCSSLAPSVAGKPVKLSS